MSALCLKFAVQTYPDGTVGEIDRRDANFDSVIIAQLLRDPLQRIRPARNQDQVDVGPRRFTRVIDTHSAGSSGD